MLARREGLDESGGQVTGEDDPTKASAKYKEWQNKKIKDYLTENIDTHATDHSTILTNGMHAQQALAYDVAVGLCHIRDKDLHKLRVAADWRLLDGLDGDEMYKHFKQYFEFGRIENMNLRDWVIQPGCEGAMPDKIVDQREHPAPRAQARPGGHA